VAERDAYRRDAELRKEALVLLERPGAKLVQLAQQGGATATASVIWHPDKAFVLGRGLAAPSGRDYQLWVIRGARKIPAGLLRGDAGGALVTAIDPALLAGGAPDAFAVTLEVAGGKPQPEGPVVLVGKI
jgi:anti-sigma-K factor RskA